jgi:hypothetical protein
VDGDGTVTIEELKKIQADNNLCDFHLVHTDDERFTIAHTDAERATGQPLEECPVHQYMLALPHNPFPFTPRQLRRGAPRLSAVPGLTLVRAVMQPNPHPLPSDRNRRRDEVVVPLIAVVTVAVAGSLIGRAADWSGMAGWGIAFVAGLVGIVLMARGIVLHAAVRGDAKKSETSGATELTAHPAPRNRCDPR